MEHEVNDKDKIIRRAFWSTSLTYRQWKRRVKNAKSDSFYWVDACSHLPFSFLAEELGINFIKRWPDIRQHITSPAAQTNKASIDARWAVALTTDSQFPIDRRVSEMPTKRRQVHGMIVRKPSITSYEISKLTGRDYSAVHRDVGKLVSDKLIEVRTSTNQNNVTRRPLFSTLSVNTKIYDACHQGAA